jgi:hypothetical protein
MMRLISAEPQAYQPQFHQNHRTGEWVVVVVVEVVVGGVCV